jgi:hypothetical protein
MTIDPGPSNFCLPENAAGRHRFGRQWDIVGDPDYRVRVERPRANFDPRNLRWLVYGAALVALGVWAVLR